LQENRISLKEIQFIALLQGGMMTMVNQPELLEAEALKLSSAERCCHILYPESKCKIGPDVCGRVWTSR